MGDIQVIGDLTASQVIAVENECEAFIDDLPPIFRLEAPDTSLDEQHPYFIFQRCQLHVVIYMTQLDFLKPYLTRSPHDRIGDHDNEFRTMGIDLSLKLLRVARTLFDHEFPINAKFHLVVFCIFDTATILCSAIIHDVDNDLPHREQVMDQIESALEMLHQLSETTKIGASSYNFLIKLVQASPVLSRHAPIRKRQRVDATSASAPGSATPSAEQITDRAVPFTDTIAKSAFTAMEPLPLIPVSESGPALNPVPQESTTDDLKFDLDQFLQENPFGSNAQLDMGGLEQIWDWENLNLDAFLNQDPPTSQG
jgi:hypothetical protein